MSRSDDLLIVIARWATPEGDLMGDGTTDISDVLLRAPIARSGGGLGDVPRRPLAYGPLHAATTSSTSLTPTIPSPSTSAGASVDPHWSMTSSRSATPTTPS